MRFLYIIDPIDTWDITKDTTYTFLRESQSRGHENWACGIDELMVEGGQVSAAAAPLEINDIQGKHWEYGERKNVAADYFHAIFMRKDPPFDTEFFFSTHIQSLVDEKKTFLFNRPSGLREATEKLFILRFPDLIAETFVSASASEILSFAARVGRDIVVKPLDGCGGEGIFRITKGDLNTNSILETITENGCRQVMAQRFLPASRQGDMRLIMLDGKPLGAMKRVPRDDDLRGNLHVGGSSITAEIGPRELQICERLAPSLRELGLYFVGLDIIGEHLTEVNVTSPTGVQEVNALSGVKLEADVIDFVEKKCGELAGR